MTVEKQIKNYLRDKSYEIYSLIEKKGQLEDELHDPDYSEEHNQKVFRELGDIRVKIGNMQNQAMNECLKIINQYRDEIKSSYRLRVEDITDDAKLFNLGVTLPLEEVENIFDRNAGNTTMQKLTMMYAHQHGLRMHGNRVVVNPNVVNANALENTTRMYVDHWLDKSNSAGMLEKFFPGDE